eukprot:Rmarinus@m.6209
MEESSRLLKLRGLPFQATESDLKGFFNELPVNSVHFMSNYEGRPNGEAFVLMETIDAANEALKFHRKNLGSRYVEVFKHPEGDMPERMVADNKSTNVIRLRGMPYTATSDDVHKFFSELAIEQDGVLMVQQSGRSTGEAYVRFASEGDADEALRKNKQNMGSRYIEVFRSTPTEMSNAQARMTGYRRQGG